MAITSFVVRTVEIFAFILPQSVKATDRMTEKGPNKIIGLSWKSLCSLSIDTEVREQIKEVTKK